MSEDNYRSPEARHKRVQRLKKLIILFLMISIAIPIICCIVLFGQVYGLNKRLDSMELQLETMLQNLSEQQQQLEEWQAMTQSTGQGEATRGQALSEQLGVNRLTEDNAETDSNINSIQKVEQKELHKVYLTFDDGPSVYTDEILDILARYDVKATFFVVGKEDEASQAALRRIAEEGHTIGLHSYSHKYSQVYSSVEDFAEDFLKLQRYVYELTGIESKIYRFPGGSSNTVSELPMKKFVEYLDSQDVKFFDWNVSSGDGGRRLLEVETLVENVTSGITDRGTSVILLHDAAEKKSTVEALPIIIENILALEDTVILPITEETEPVQHIEVNK